MEVILPLMKIQLNGIPHELETSMPVSDLLVSIGIAGKPVVVELDGQAVFPRDYPDAWVKDGAQVEIVTLAAGG